MTTRKVTPQIGDRIFHVFSEDFVHSELRQSNFVVNGNIESKITLDHTMISTKDAEDKVQQSETRLSESIAALERELAKAKDEQLSTKAGVNKRLREYMAIQLAELMSNHTALPVQSARNFGNVLSDLDALKSVPAEPDYPGDIEGIRGRAIDTARIDVQEGIHVRGRNLAKQEQGTQRTGCQVRYHSG